MRFILWFACLLASRLPSTYRAVEILANEWRADISNDSDYSPTVGNECGP
jgi:hypothetical protein